MSGDAVPYDASAPTTPTATTLAPTTTPPSPGAIQREWRAKIQALEEALLALPDHWEGTTEHLPVRHHFADHLCAREIFMPQGTVVTGKIHTQSHITLLVEGTLLIIDEFTGRQMLTAPEWFVSPRGVKRAIAVLEDCRFLCVFGTDETDPVRLEAQLTVMRYEDLLIEEAP